MKLPIRLFKCIISLVLLTVSTTLTQSCTKLYYQTYSWVYGQGYARSTKHTLSKSLEMVDSCRNRSIVIVPMFHIGQTEDYEKIGYFLDGLKANGYVVFKEGIKPADSITDSATIDTLERKFRRILGLDLDTYTSNGASKHRGWTVQSEELLHINTDKDINTDVTIDEFVRQFELENGPIILDEYDFTCPIGENANYKRKLPKGYNWKFISIVSTYRDKVLWDHIINDGYDKIAIVYGGDHTKLMKYSLKREGFRMKYPRGKQRNRGER